MDSQLALGIVLAVAGVAGGAATGAVFVIYPEFTRSILYIAIAVSVVCLVVGAYLIGTIKKEVVTPSVTTPVRSTGLKLEGDSRGMIISNSTIGGVDVGIDAQNAAGSSITNTTINGSAVDRRP